MLHLFDPGSDACDKETSFNETSSTSNNDTGIH